MQKLNVKGQGDDLTSVNMYQIYELIVDIHKNAAHCIGANVDM
jgi:hypothetical protein